MFSVVCVLHLVGCFFLIQTIVSISAKLHIVSDQACYPYCYFYLAPKLYTPQFPSFLFEINNSNSFLWARAKYREENIEFLNKIAIKLICKIFSRRKLTAINPNEFTNHFRYSIWILSSISHALFRLNSFDKKIHFHCVV